jgi:hypothetical protein
MKEGPGIFITRVTTPMPDLPDYSEIELAKLNRSRQKFPHYQSGSSPRTGSL